MKKLIALAATGALCAGIAIGALSAGLIQDIKAEIRQDFTVLIDGEKQTFRNANGDIVYPILYNGTTYLPVRAIGEIMGKTVYWDESKKQIELKGQSGQTVTDADVFVGQDNKGNNKPTTGNGGGQSWRDSVKLTEADAKAIALKKAGLSEADVTFIKSRLEMDDGIAEYEIDFINGSTEYEADIDANTGDVRKWEIDQRVAPQNNGASTGAETSISLTEAKNIALERAGLAEKDVTFTKSELDLDDGKYKYEIEFRSGRTEYEAEIDANTGNIISWEIDD